MSRRQNKKFFGAAVFQKCCRGVGEQPTFAEQIQFCSLFFLLQLHFLKLANSQFDCLCETSCKFGQGNGAIAARWQAKAGVEPPFAGCGRTFSLGAVQSVSRETLHQNHTIASNEPQANKKFFDPTIFQKCWRGSGRAALIAARRQRNPRAILLAHGGGGEKSDSFSRRGEQDRPALLP